MRKAVVACLALMMLAGCGGGTQQIDRSDTACIRTLADVECHPKSDPYGNNETILASPPPKAIKP